MTSHPTSRQLVVFSLGAEEYALGIEDVHEIIRYTEPRAVSSSDESVRGVISLRGRILPLFDLSVRLGVTATHDLDTARIVVVSDGDEMAGLMVDSVTEVLTVDAEQFADAPVPGTEWIAGVVRVEDRLLILLDHKAITALSGSAADDQASAVA
jgi:purine-binding chemotaxis protein CheW